MSVVTVASFLRTRGDVVRSTLTPLDLIGLADIMLVPSQWGEPFGLVAAEAMSGGAVPIVFRDGGLPEVLGTDLSDNVVDSASDMARRVNELLGDSARRLQDRAVGYRRASSYFHVSRMADELDASLDRALSRSTQRTEPRRLHR